MTSPDDDLTTLATWLEPRLGDARDLRLEAAGKPSSGFSAETTILSATWTGPDGARSERLVLRRETPDPPVYPTQVPGLTTEVDIQYRVMEALSRAGTVPIAPLHGYEADPAVLGAPFFVMGFVDGVVPIESPMYTLEGFFTELAPDRRRVMLDAGMAAMAAVHAIDWRGAGLDWLLAPGASPDTTHQLDLWEAYGERELAGRHHPVWERGLAWLKADVPAGSTPALCWGDPRPGNVIWRDEQPICLTDFEAACLAPPEVDLGWWLMSDRWAHEISGVERLDGEPTRAQQTAAYEAAAGRSVGGTTWWEVFAAMRYTAIVVRVMNRMVDRGHLPADQTIWLENPAAACLAHLLEEIDA
ncbi:phosphotransferase family protein [Rhabdothermincola salaria]|uniref:phosphotransferase family protein n=1 Tax=Rhabdothermincola salaria TaxID=2903142 RepID=UPI001E5ABCCA|nr:phosphotransferase family protein [Rhabdothermincola salaria]